MPTLRTVTVKPSGGDYTSLHAAVVGEVADLVALDRRLDIACYAMQDTTPVLAADWAGYATDATRYIRIYTPSTERHNGTRSPTKYRLEVTTGFESALKVNQDYTRVEGLQLRGSPAGFATLNTNTTFGGAITAYISDCISYDTATQYGFQVNSGYAAFFNCVSMDNGFDGFHVGGGGNASGEFYNCDAVNNGNYGFNFGQFNPNIITSCYAGGNTSGDYNTVGGGPSVVFTDCWSADGSSGTATNGPWSTSVATWSTSSGGYFTNIIAGTENVSIGSSSALRDSGVDLSLNAAVIAMGGAVDIIGTVRPQGPAWDVGVFEYFAPPVVGVQPPQHLAYGTPASGVSG